MFLSLAFAISFNHAESRKVVEYASSLCIIYEPWLSRRIQSVFQLSDGSGMAVTIARYETPAHINIDKVLQLSTHLLMSF